VLQYVILRPVLSIVGIICQKKGILCESGSWSFHTAKAYITVIDGVSITFALYGLIVFYGLTKDELKGRRPLAKFLAIKLIVMFTFYQSLVFGALEGRVIHGTQYWTETNIADGLNALAICIEMVFFSAFMMWAYTWNEYKVKGTPRTSIWRPLWDSINYTDFVIEIFGSLKFFWDAALGKKHTRTPRITTIDGDGKTRPKMDFGEAFGVEGHTYSKNSGYDHRYPASGEFGQHGHSLRQRPSYDEEIRLAPYKYSGANASGGVGFGFGGGPGSGKLADDTSSAGNSSEPGSGSPSAMLFPQGQIQGGERLSPPVDREGPREERYSAGWGSRPESASGIGQAL